jgi:hypothetical protein
MATGVGGQLYLSLQVDGVEVPIATSPALKIFISQNCKQALPVAKLSVPDLVNVFASQIPINDGSVISVRLNDDNQEAYPGYTTMRAMGTPVRSPSSQFMQYNITAMLDAFPYIRANPSSNFQGSSVEVMQQIAQAVGLNYMGTISTNDNMNWLPGRNTWGKFAMHLATHGWIDERSAISPPAVDEQRNLHHININDHFSNGPVKANLFYGGNASMGSIPQLSGERPYYPVLQYRAINRSGLMNNWHGYGLRLAQSDVISGNVNRYSNILAQTVNNVLDISKDILGQVGARARIDVPPIDTGNTHDFYLQAKHQNLRTHAYYSQNVYVLIPYTTGLTLYDMVHLEVNSNDYADSSSTGMYTITAMTRALIGARYYEKLELTSAGPQNENSSLIA